MRWCTRPDAGYDLNPVDGSKQGGPENHPKHEMAFIERQADFRCGTEGRYFVAKVSGDVRYYRDTKQRMLDEAVEGLRELGHLCCNAENIFINPTYKKPFADYLRLAIEYSTISNMHELYPMQRGIARSWLRDLEAPLTTDA